MSAQRLLITGANGFVGPYAAEACRAAGFEVIQAGFAGQDCDVALDVCSQTSVDDVVANVAPTAVLHLAGQSFVPASIEDPLATYNVNVMGTARLTTALRALGRPVRLLFVSSAEVYGYQALKTLPLVEELAPQPGNPYAASKAAAELLARAGRGNGLEVVIARPFNHIGPGQDSRFVVAGFAKQLADIRAGGAPVLAVGNLEAERDFLDVRDVAQAYVELLQHGRDGETYNIARGEAVAIREILRRCIMLADVPVTVRQDPERMRPSEIPRFYGDATKLRTATGWQPRISLDASLEAILKAAEQPITAG